MRLTTTIHRPVVRSKELETAEVPCACNCNIESTSLRDEQSVFTSFAKP